MKKGVSMVKKALALFIVTLFLSTAGVGTAPAGEFHCQSSGDRCNVTPSTRSASIYCMKSSENWHCILPVMGDIECTAPSGTRTLPRTFWHSSAVTCGSLCGRCSGGWDEYQGGGSTF